MIDIKLKKKEAADFLSSRGRRIEIIFFGLLLVFATLVPIFLLSYIEYLLLVLVGFISDVVKLSESVADVLVISASVIAFACAILFAIFVTFPIFSCFFGNSYRIYREGIAGGRRFLDFGERGYFGAILSGSVIFGVLAFCLAPVIALAELGMHFAFHEDSRIAMLVSYFLGLIIAVGLVIGFFIFMLFRPFFLFGYYTAKGEKVGVALSKSLKRMRSERAKQIYKAYIKTFLPSLLLSIATLLVLFLIDTLPKMSMVYFDIADDIAYGE